MTTSSQHLTAPLRAAVGQLRRAVAGARLALGVGAALVATLGPSCPVANAAETAASVAAGPIVLFDEGHGQRFHVASAGPLDLSSLARELTRAGARVETLREPLSAGSLARADALVVSGAFVAVTPAEQDAVLAFLERGGRLAVMLHVGPPMAGLLHRLGVSISNGVVHEEESAVDGNAINFRVTRMTPHPLTAGLEGFRLYGAWALLPLGKETLSLAESGPHAWVDLNANQKKDDEDAEQAFSVAVAGTRGKGSFIAIGDDALLQNQFLTSENLRLARNLARWLGAARAGEMVALASPPADPVDGQDLGRLEAARSKSLNSR